MASPLARLALAAALLAPAVAAPAPPPARVVAVGDVHGAHDQLVALLGATGLASADGRWTGGAAVLVQTGDVLDRGPDSRRVMDLLMDLEEQAREAGGRVVVLLGNHEAMNLLGDLRYVSAEEYASYADDGSEKRRREALEKWKAMRARRGVPATAADEAGWLAAHPGGFVEHRKSLSARGRYGKWLRARPALAVLGDTLFVHGGVSPGLAARGVEDLVAGVRRELEAFDRGREELVRRGLALPFSTFPEVLAAAREAQAAEGGEPPGPVGPLLDAGSWLSVSSDGPLWYRGLAGEGEEAPGPDEAAVEALLAALGVGRIVVGHTTRPDGRIASRHGGKVFVIDTGMLSSHYEGGRASALEIRPHQVSAVYLDGREVLWQAPASGAAGRRGWLDPEGAPLPFARDEEVLDFLSAAEVRASKPVGEGITDPRKLLLERDGLRAHAIFRYVDVERQEVKLRGSGHHFRFRDSYLFELAAWELSRLLGLDAVPPVVKRRVAGKWGAVQIWVEQAMTETERLKQRLVPPAGACWHCQMSLLEVWDALVDNIDRNSGNLLVDAAGKVWLIDHTRAFRTARELREPEGVARCERGLYSRLRALDPAAVRERLGDCLREEEIEALLARRDAIVAHLERLIAERGEDQVLFDAP